MFGRETTKYTFMYSVKIRFWPTLPVLSASVFAPLSHLCQPTTCPCMTCSPLTAYFDLINVPLTAYSDLINVTLTAYSDLINVFLRAYSDSTNIPLTAYSDSTNIPLTTYSNIPTSP